MIFTLRKKAQSTIEITVLAIIIMASTLAMGPYVIRAWNGYVKGMDDSIEDSFSDPLIEDGNLTVVSPCECKWDFPEGCEDAECSCGKGGCSEFEHSVTWQCEPNNCQDAPLNPSGLPITPDYCAGARCCEESDECCVITNLECGSASVGCTGGCPDGYRCRQRACTTNTDFYCEPDPNCAFTCGALYPVGNPYGPRCPGDDVGLTDAESGNGWRFVHLGECSVPAGSSPKCQGQCNTLYPDPLGRFYVPNADRTNCVQAPFCRIGGTYRLDTDDSIIIPNDLTGEDTCPVTFEGAYRAHYTGSEYSGNNWNKAVYVCGLCIL